MMSKKILSIGIYLTGFSAFGFIVSILTFFFYAKNIIGKFPTYGTPDPKELEGYKNYNIIISFSFDLWIICFLVWGALFFILMSSSKKRKIFKKHFIVTSIVHFIGIIILLSPVFEWYVD